jgi:phytoene synthase
MPSLTPDALAVTSAAADLAACRELLRNGSRTFLAASLLLPRAVHEPACALYAFCRLADDAVDGADASGDTTSAVQRLRERLALAYAGTPRPLAADRALADVVARFAIPRALPEALIEGFEWDATGRRYDTLQELSDYAARVAGSVGAMMSLVMGVRSAEAVARACDLGVAMQLSNIARDVGEDARMGRLYLPRQWLREAGIDADAWLAQPVYSATRSDAASARTAAPASKAASSSSARLAASPTVAPPMSATRNTNCAGSSRFTRSAPRAP